MEDESNVKRGPGRPRKHPGAEVNNVQEKQVFDETPVVTMVHRVTLSDLPGLTPSLVPLISAHFNGAPMTMVTGWLRLWVLDNNFNIAMTENAVSVVAVINDPMDATPIIQEIFTYHKEGADAEVRLLINHFLQWGKTIGAYEFRFDPYDLVTRDTFRRQFPGSRYRSQGYVEI